MKAAIVSGPNQVPRYADFQEPELRPGLELITVSAAALTHATRGRAAGSHYSASGFYPHVVGIDGVGRTARGHRVFFMAPEAPFGGMAQSTLVREELCVAVPEGLDDVTAAAIGNPGLSSVAALRLRANFKTGETVLVNGATGTAGKLAVQIAKCLGAGKVIGTGRNVAVLEELKGLGAEVTLNLTLDQEKLSKALEDQFEEGIDIVLDYVSGKSAELLLAVAARAIKGSRPLRYVEIGGMGGSELVLRAGILRAKPITLMGSGIGSAPLRDLVGATAEAMQAAVAGGLLIATRAVPLADVYDSWGADIGQQRVVFVVQPMD